MFGPVNNQVQSDLYLSFVVYLEGEEMERRDRRASFVVSQ